MLCGRDHEAFAEFEKHGVIRRPYIPKHCRQNAHMYYLRFNGLEERTKLITVMKANEIHCVFHYIPLHNSPAGLKDGRFVGDMSVTNTVSDTLVRLPLFYGLEESNQDYVIEKACELLRGLR